MPNELWPPLAVIQRRFDAGAAPAAQTPARAQPLVRGGAAPHGPAGDDDGDTTHEEALLLPLTELARRRAVLATRAFSARWAPGRLVSVVHEGRLLGVLLDRPLGSGPAWQGWLAASEADWASAHDVLLEPQDEPFEPLFGVVQAWNPVLLAPAPHHAARVQGELSATRLAAIRAVHDEFLRGEALDIPPEAGQVALRSVAGGDFSVLTGTPLAGADDPRGAYQRLYGEAARQLSAPSGAPAAADDVATGVPPSTAGRDEDRAAGGGFGAQLRRWLGGDGWLRPAFAALALVVVLQNVAPLAGRGGADDDDGVRFRGGATPAEGRTDADLAVTWKPGVKVEESAQLLRSVQAEVVAGPDARGAWFLRVPDAGAGRDALSASPLVQSVGPP